MKIRNEQLEELRKGHLENIRAARIKDFRDQGFKADQEPNTGDILTEDAAGGKARIAYRTDGATFTSGEGRTLHSEFDSQGQLAALTDPAGLRVSFEHDAKGRLAAVQRGNHSTYRLGFGSRDELTAIQFPDGAVTRFDYNTAGQLESVTDRNGNTTRAGYSDGGSLVSVTDAGGNTTCFEYDPSSGSSAILFPDGSRHDFEFDTNENLRKMQVNGKEHATFHLDEQAGRFQVDYIDGTKAHFVFQDEKIIEATNETCTVKLEYNDKGHIIREDTDGQIVEYLRNEVGALIGIVTPEGERLTFERDADHTVRHITDWSGGRYAISYTPVGALGEIRYPNGSSLTMTATQMGLAESLAVFSPLSPKPAVLRRWDYDTCDRVTKLTDGVIPRHYRYDGEGRLLEVASADERLTERFELDANGNRTRDAAGICEFGALNQLTRRGENTFGYDERGNITSGPLRSGQARYTYNGRDQLVAVDTTRGRTRYAYDAFGRRVRKECDGRVTRYVWAGQQLLSEVTTDGTKRTRRDFLMYPERPVPLAMRVDGKIFYLHPGRLGEPLCMTDKEGEVVWQADYSAFGQARIVTERVPQPFRLPGQYFDEETGLHYVLARYYNPELGRYLTIDPLRVDGGSLNFYIYCDGDPINRYDPTGQFIIPGILIAIAVGAVIGAVIGAGVETYKQVKSGKPIDGWAIAKEAGIGAVVGAVGGAIGFAAGGVGVLAAGGIGAASSAAEYCTEQALRGEEITAGGFVANALIGGVIGAVTAGIGGLWAARTARKVKRAAEAIVEQRADEIVKLRGKRASDRETFNVALVQKKGDPSTRRVVITSSNEMKTAPRNIKLKPGETFANPGPHLVRRPVRGPDGKILKDTKGRPIKRTYERIETPDGKVEYRSYEKGKRTDHHAEQRTKKSLAADEEIVAQAPTRGCCAGCQKALGDDLGKVPPHRRSKEAYNEYKKQERSR